MVRKYKIAVLPGDGIGREVVPEAVKVLKAVTEVVSGLNLEFIDVEGGAMYWLEHGKKEEWPEGSYDICKESDAILLGAIGMDARYADGTLVGTKVIFGIRFGLDLYANVRPVKLYEGVPCPILIKDPNQIDFVIIRENTEDLYVPIRGFLTRGDIAEMAADVRVITRKGAERVIKYAFELSRERMKGAPIDKKKRVTCIDKSNVLRGCLFFRQIFDEVAKNYPDIERDYSYIDAWTQWVIRRPGWYDVCVTTNMFGDIITDLASVLQGGMGMSPAGNIGDKHAMFEPIHGSAPSHYGKKIVNPTATILAAKMMLEWLGKKHNDESAMKSANIIEKAVEKTLRDGKIRTYDLGGVSKTNEVGDAIVKAVKSIEES